MNLKRHHLCIALAATLTGKIAAAPIAISAPGSYTQNFNTMFFPAASGSVATTGATNWTDDSTIPGWWYHYSSNVAGAGIFGGTSFVHYGNDGSAAPVLTLNSAGAAGAADRAFCTPSTTGRGEQSGIVIFQNTSPAPLSITAIQYAGEVYRTNGNSNVVESVIPHFRVSDTLTEALALSGTSRTAAQAAVLYPATIATSPTAGNYLTGWTRMDSAIWTYSTSVGATPKTGTGADSTLVNASGLTGLNVGPGKYIAIRFSNPNDAGTDALMGIDDLSITFAVPPNYLEAAVSNVTRSINGTPNDPTDDLVSFAVTVTGSTGVWDADSPLLDYGPDSGAFGTPVAYSNLPIILFSTAPPYAVLSDFSISQILFGPTLEILQRNFTVNAPAPSLNVTANSFMRDTVDYFTANLNVTGQFVSDSWNITGLAGDPLPVRAYNVNTALAPMPATGPQGPFTISDSVATAATSSFYLLPPYLIGYSLLGAFTEVISTGRLTETPVNWIPNPATQSLSMNDGDANGAGTAPQEISSTVNLAGIDGPVKFSMQLVTMDTSTGFESGDSFAAELIYNDGTTELPPVSLVAPDQETVALNSTLTGAELATDEDGGKTFNFSAIIPDNIVSVRLVFRGIVDSFSETMVIQNILFEEAGATLNVTQGTASIDNKGTVDPLDDKLSVPVTITAFGQGASTGWYTDLFAPDAPVTGLYSAANPVVFDLDFPLSPATSRTFTIADNLNPVMTSMVIAGSPTRSLTATLVAGSINRDEKGTSDPADDTVSFQLNITGTNAGPEFTAAIALRPGTITGAGVYPPPGAPVTLTMSNVPSTAANASVVIADASYPTLPAPVTIAVAIPAASTPAIHILGTKVFNGVTTDLVAQNPVPLWVNYPQGRQTVMTTGLSIDTIIESEIMDLTNIATVTVSAVLRARDNSTGSNFEAADRFKIDMVIDGDTFNPVNLVTPAMDLGNGNDATVDPGVNGAANGYLNGYNGAAASDFLTPAITYPSPVANYNANALRDEFNPGGLTADVALDTLITFTGSVPAGANSVQIRIFGQSVAGSESYTVQDVVITGESGGGSKDCDGDGMSDAYEVANGLAVEINDAFLDKDSDGQSNLAEYLAGTAANNPADLLDVVSISMTSTIGVYDVVLSTVPGKRYQLLVSTDIGTNDDWTPVSAVTSAAASPATTTTIRATLTGDRVFMRGVVIP